MRKGFTLVELMVVIAVIAILVAVVSPQFSIAKERAVDREGKAVVRLIQEAERIRKMEKGSYGAINDSELRLNLPVSSSWTYSVDLTAGSETVTATRSKTGGRALTAPLCCETSSCAATCTPTCTPNSDTCY